MIRDEATINALRVALNPRGERELQLRDAIELVSGNCERFLKFVTSQ